MTKEEKDNLGEKIFVGTTMTIVFPFIILALLFLWICESVSNFFKIFFYDYGNS